MNENLEPKIEKTKGAEEIKLLKFYKNERYNGLKQIEEENEETLLSGFRQEIKDMQEEIKNKKSSKPLYEKERDILELKPDNLILEDAKIWEYFKMFSGNLEKIREFEKKFYKPYIGKVTKEIFEEIKQKIDEKIENDTKINIFHNHPRINFSQDLIGNYLMLKSLYFERQGKLKKF